MRSWMRIRYGYEAWQPYLVHTPQESTGRFTPDRRSAPVADRPQAGDQAHGAERAGQLPQATSVSDGWSAADGQRRMVGDGWSAADGQRRMVGGGWSAADGRRRMVGGAWGELVLLWRH